jgi:hypothetical protein
MMGMRPASAGPGRQIQDATYYSGLLRSKISLLTAEITKLKGDIEQFNKDNSTYVAVRLRFFSFSRVRFFLRFRPVSLSPSRPVLSLSACPVASA